MSSLVETRMTVASNLTAAYAAARDINGRNDKQLQEHLFEVYLNFRLMLSKPQPLETSDDEDGMVEHGESVY